MTLVSSRALILKKARNCGPFSLDEVNRHMPLFEGIEGEIRAHLKHIAEGVRLRPMLIGQLTAAQHDAINVARTAHGLPGLELPEIVFLGRHLHQSRIVRDGYTIDDVIAQMTSALAESAVVHASSKMTTVRSIVVRVDRYGSAVRDMAILELTARKPRAELYSVIPKGDVSPARQAEAPPACQKKERPLESGLESEGYARSGNEQLSDAPADPTA